MSTSSMRRRARMASAGMAATIAGVAAGCGGSASEPEPAAEAADSELASERSSARAETRRCPEKVRPHGSRCGTIEVPLERADPSLGTTRITFALRPRSDRTRPSRGAILAIEGGPGYGSIVSARAYVRLFGPLLRHRELVTVDMRGTGHSQALDCPDLQSGLGPEPLAASQCARRLGKSFASYRTAAAADDLDDVRRALGFDRLDVYGDSYGTFLAQSYAFRHSERVRALVLDSAYPVRGESGWYRSLPRTGVRSLATVCRREPGCRGDANARLERFIAALRDKGRSLAPLLEALGSAGYAVPDGYLKLDAAVSSYLAGDRRPYERLTATARTEFGPERYYSHALELAVSCNDYPMIWDRQASEPERRRQLEQEIRNYPKDAFEPFTAREIALASEFGYLDCLTWPAPTELYEPPVPAGASAPDVPTLVMAGEFDDVTTPAEAAMVARDFPDSRLFVVHNAGHVPSLYRSRYPAAARVRAFLRRHG